MPLDYNLHQSKGKVLHDAVSQVSGVDVGQLHLIGKIHASALDIVRLDASLDVAHAAPRQATAWCAVAPVVLEVLFQRLSTPVLATPS